MTHSAAVQSLDIRTCDVRDGQLEGYFWPVNRDDRIAGTYALVEYLCRYFREEEHTDVYIIRLLHAFLSVEVTSVIQAQLLRDKLKPGQKIDIPEEAGFWQMALKGRPQIGKQAAGLQKGLAKPSIVFRIARSFKPASMCEGLKPLARAFAPLKRGIIATGGGPLLVAHAECTDEMVYYCPLYEWFYPATEDELAAHQDYALDKQMLDRFLDGLVEALDKTGCQLSADFQGYLRQWLNDTGKWVQLYLTRLRRNPGLIPNRLWTGSQGIIWNRMLSYIVQENGGTVTVHDHALGANASLESNTMFVEGQECDRFLTFSDAVRDMLHETAKWQLFSDHMPDIVAISALQGPLKALAGKSILAQAKRPVTTPPRKILYVQPIYLIDRGEMFPVMSDMVAADWQIRLFGWLRDKGYEVLVKPHPETYSNLSAQVFEKLGVTVLGGRFEEVYDEGDLLLYDYTLTTTLGSGLISDRPVVHIDFGYSKLPPVLREMLERRAPSVPGYFDAENKAQTDWFALEQLLANARRMDDHEYAQKVLGL